MHSGVISPQAQAILRSYNELNPMPSLALDILSRLSASETITPKLLERIQIDPGAVACLLRHCNSPFFGLRRQILSLNQAANLLGWENLKSLLTTYYMRSHFTTSSDQRLQESLWNHAIACASMSRHLARACDRDEHLAYLCGLLHDLGKPPMLQARREAFTELLQTRVCSWGALEEEQRLMGTTHPEVGALLGEVWNLGQDLITVIERHHEPLIPHTAPAPPPLLPVVALANHLVHYQEQDDPEIRLPLLAILDLTDADLQLITGQAMDEIAHLQSLL